MKTGRWQKSTASNPSGNCVELEEQSDGTIAIRDSDRPSDVAITTRANLAAFFTGVRNGEFDHFTE